MFCLPFNKINDFVEQIHENNITIIEITITIYSTKEILLKGKEIEKEKTEEKGIEGKIEGIEVFFFFFLSLWCYCLLSVSLYSLFSLAVRGW